MHASLVAWVSATLGAIGIVSSVIQWVWYSASLEGRLIAVVEKVDRNFRDDERYRESVDKNIGRIDTTIGGMSQVFVKIGVLETKLTSIDDALRRIERRIDGGRGAKHHKE